MGFYATYNGASENVPSVMCAQQRLKSHCASASLIKIVVAHIMNLCILGYLKCIHLSFDQTAQDRWAHKSTFVTFGLILKRFWQADMVSEYFIMLNGLHYGHSAYQLQYFVKVTVGVCGFTSSCACGRYHPGFCSTLLHSIYMYHMILVAVRDGPYLTASMCRLIWASTVSMCQKTHFRVARPNN